MQLLTANSLQPLFEPGRDVAAVGPMQRLNSRPQFCESLLDLLVMINHHDQPSRPDHCAGALARPRACALVHFRSFGLTGFWGDRSNDLVDDVHAKAPLTASLAYVPR